MARIDVLPSIDIIRGFKGILDFYLWRGLPCVRAWPKYRPARQTAASLAAALLFGAIIKAYSLTHDTVLDQLTPEILGIPRTARDVYVSGVYGNLHEASMSDFLDLITECRDFLSIMVSLVDALHSIDTDELLVRVEHSVLPDTAATAAAQATQLAALQKIDDLQDALESKALDRLLVRGQDQLYSLKTNLLDDDAGVISGAGGWYELGVVPAAQIWTVTHVHARDVTSPTTRHRHYINRVGAIYNFHEQTAAFAANRPSMARTWLWLYPGDRVRVYFDGALAGDTCLIQLIGHRTTLET